jgi:hypothetical protein
MLVIFGLAFYAVFPTSLGPTEGMAPAIVGALIGALAAGVPAYLIAERQSAETLKRDNDERERRDKLSANKVFVKLMQICNEFLDTRKQIERMLTLPVSADDRFPIQRRVSVLVGLNSEPMTFEADELAIFVSKTDVDLINDLELLRRRRNALVIQFGEYKDRKIAHSALLSNSREFQYGTDGMIRMKVSPEQLAKLQYEEAQIESLIAPMIDVVREESRTCLRVAEKFNVAVKHLFSSGVQQFDTATGYEALAAFGDKLSEDA